MANLETVDLYGLNQTATYDPAKVAPIIVGGTDIYDQAVITEGEEPLLIAWDDGMSEWVCLGSPDDLGWERMDPDSAESIARTIRASDKWQLDLGDDSPERQLCKLAGLEDEFETADGDTFESVIYKAADILGVEI